MGRHGILRPGLAALVLLAGCEQARQVAASLGELQAVQQAVAKSTGQQVQVHLQNGRYLSVALVNSPLGSLPADQRRDRSLVIARLAYQSYASRSSLDSVTVTLVERHTTFLVFRSSRAERFRFGPPELAGPPDAAAPGR